MRGAVCYQLVGNGVTITVNPSTRPTSGWYSKPGGIVASIGVNAAVVDRPQAHGSYLDASWNNGVGVSFTLLNVGAPATRQTAADTLAKLLYYALGDVSDVTLYWNPQGTDGVDVTGVTATTRRISGLRMVQPAQWGVEAGPIQNVQFVLQSEYPYSESANATNTDTAALGATSSGFSVPLTIPFTLVGSGAGTASVQNDGNADAYPIMRVYGPIVAPVVTNLANNKRLVFSGSIAANDYWEIDLFNRTVTLNGGATSMISGLDLTQSTWFGFAPSAAPTTVQLSGTGYTGDTKLRVLMRSAWI